MHSFIDLERTLGGQPVRLGARLARVDVGRGREELSRDQLPELLTALAEETRVASITASNAIEGVIVGPGRAEKLAVPEETRFRNRNEREFAGYRDAVDEVMRQPAEPLTIPYILHLHRQLFHHVDGRGGHLKTDQNLIVSYEAGVRHVIFTPPPPARTEGMLRELVDRYLDLAHQEAAHPLVLISAFILDFLAIHPVADGNGRLARLLTTKLLLDAGYGVSRYVSIEQRIFETKNAYYAALAASQEHWHEAEHTIWPWVGYHVGILAGAYDAFETKMAVRRGLASLTKHERVKRYVLEHGPRTFRVRDIRAALPGISDVTIRVALRELRQAGRIRPVEGTSGPHAAWTLVVE